jgi:sec-independent protein translocase protein TatA
MNFGWQELLLILAIVVLLFGATRLPALGKSVGQSIRGFRSGLKGDEPEPKKLEEGEAGKEPAAKESAEKKPDEPGDGK